ncbi:Arf-GAP with Rho-GAP domain, ANK repeat and PH domain-containing protein 1-like [Oopsacas minuta]|uniref:Arf-GAP with Rho-GAP domain, ANK repeat and PH domain-containing protein 1-like n=1 Tax=Oopsacas minuta TaxID=111878 RepID=A0AAV7JBC7_9METZ|nr:Arf-GAP with Rho-GAP domain, ANK repeat and PH domain-containing protein 1-like [Oopsacas minuta]
MSTRPANKLSTSEVDRWLQCLKLPQYAPVFKHNGLTSLSQCQGLTRRTLGVMGITLPGHVTRMERAILNLRLDRTEGFSKTLSKSSEDLRKNLLTTSTSFYNRSGVVVNMNFINRSESDPELSGPTELPDDLERSSTPVYFDLLSQITPVVNNIQTNGQVYDSLESHEAIPHKKPFTEEITELDPLTNQPIIFTRNNTEVPIPSPRHTSSKRHVTDIDSTEFPRDYDELTRQILLSQKEHKPPRIDAAYTMIDENLIDNTQLLHHKNKKSDYDQLTAASLLPIIHPDTPLLSPPHNAKSLPSDILAAIGLKNPVSAQTDRVNPQRAPVAAPRRSPSNPSSNKVSSPQLPPRNQSQPVLVPKISAPPIPIIKTSSPGPPSLPNSSLITAPTRHMTISDPISPIQKVSNPNYISTESIELIRSSTNYIPMRPAPPPPMLFEDLPVEDQVSSSSSEDENEDVLTEVPPTKMLISLPNDPAHVCQPLKRFNTEISVTRQYSPNTLSKFVSSGQLVTVKDKEADFAPPVPVSTLEGWLFKQGGLRANKGWKKRWFIFDGYELKYFKCETSKDCQGRIPLGSMKEIQSGAEVASSQTNVLDAGVLGKQTRFVLVTLNRSYYFHAPNETDFKRWLNTLQIAMTQYKPSKETMAEGGTMNEPDKTGILLKQGHNFSKNWRPRFCAIKETRLCYYYSEEDFKVGNPINTINMRLAAVKPKVGSEGQPRFEIVIVGGRNYIFECRSLPELQEWIDALQMSVLQALTLFDPDQSKNNSAQTILNALYTNSGNLECADCRTANPSWVSLNLCVMVCIECSGVHRALGAHISKVRSVDLDQTVWTPTLVELLICLGNDEVNKLYLDRYHGEKMSVDEHTDIRKAFITAKYKEKAWLKKGMKSSVSDNTIDEQVEIHSALCEAALNGTLSETLHLILQGANPSYCDPVPRIPGQPACTPLQLSKATDRLLHHELLSQWRNDISKEFTSTIERCHLSGCMHKYSPATIKGHGRPQLRPIWQKRFFVLTQEGLSILKSEKDLDPEGEILSSEILLVQESKDLPDHQEATKFPHVFELITSKPAIYAFATLTNSEMMNWQKQLSNVINPDVFQLHGFDKWGYLEIRTSLTAAWKRRFCYLKSRVLVKLSLDKAEPERLQLQSCLSIQPPADPDSSAAKELTISFQVITQERTYSFQAESHEEAKLWYQVLKRTQVFGVPLDEQQYTRAGVPLLICKCIEFIEEDGMEDIGLYRVSGRSKQIDDLTLQFDQDCRSLVINPEVFTVHDVAGVLKRFLRALPQSLLTTELHQNFISVSELQSHNDKMYALFEFVNKLPKENKNTLMMICQHLYRVSQLESKNKMGVPNLALVFGPNIRGAGQSSQPINEMLILSETEKEVNLMNILIGHYEWLFDVKNDSDQKRKVEDAIQRMKEAQESEKKKTWSRVESNEFLITIFIDDKHGEPTTMKVSILTTAQEVFDSCVSKKFLTMENLALYEILGNNECERVVHPDEQILVVVSSWSNKNNYLSIKVNSLIRRICDFQTTRTDRVSLYMKDKTRWKKYIFWVNGGWLFSQKEGKSLFKDGPHTTKLDYVLFCGLLQSDISKNPPTKWGFWLQRSSYDTNRFLCADTEQEMYKFIASFLHAKYPNGAKSLTYSIKGDSKPVGSVSPRRQYPSPHKNSSSFTSGNLNNSEIY